MENKFIFPEGVIKIKQQKEKWSGCGVQKQRSGYFKSIE
jgi:hypothetical protein